MALLRLFDDVLVGGTEDVQVVNPASSRVVERGRDPLSGVLVDPGDLAWIGIRHPVHFFGEESLSP
jgi:hypothetical protein